MELLQIFQDLQQESPSIPILIQLTLEMPLLELETQVQELLILEQQIQAIIDLLTTMLPLETMD